MKKVEIDWNDARMYGSVWVRKTDTFPLVRCQSIGYLVSKDKEKVVLAQTNCGEDDDLGNVLSIPVPWIKKIKEIK